MRFKGDYPTSHPHMNLRISRWSIMICACFFMLNGFTFSSPGESWPLNAAGAVFAIVAIFSGPTRYRIVAAVTLVLSGVLIASDIAAGKEHRARTGRSSGD